MLPLADIRILALEQFGAGPFGSVHLAEFGAEVIKIEDPRSGGDIGRYIPPDGGGGDSLFFETFNHNKRSLGLDLSVPSGRMVFERLVRHCDVVYSNLRGDVPGNLRIRHEDLCHINPLIVCCSLSGFGMSGEQASSPGYDYMFQGLAGWMWLTGEPDSPPTKSGLSLVDFAGGLVAATSILAGVHAARRDGKGMDCDLALYDVAMNLLTYVATLQMSSGYTVERVASSAHPTLVPFQVFATSDGWIVVACAKEKFWRRLVDELGVPDLESDSRFSDFARRQANKALLIPILERIFLSDSMQAWLDRLRGAGVPACPVNNLDDALSNPMMADRNLVSEYEHERLGRVAFVRSAVDVGGQRSPVSPAPRLGADSRAILQELAELSDDQIDGLEAEGVVTMSAHGAADQPGGLDPDESKVT